MIAFVRHREFAVRLHCSTMRLAYLRNINVVRVCTHVDYAYRQIGTRLIRVVLREAWKTSEPQSIKSRHRLRKRRQETEK